MKYILIGAPLLFSRLFLLAAPYFLDQLLYNQFNRVYYSASVLTIAGSLGFNFAMKRTGIKQVYVFGAVLINILIVFLVLFLGGFDFGEKSAIYSILILAFTQSISAIFIFTLLYSGDYVIYFILNLLQLILNCAALVISHYTKIDFISLFVISNVVLFVAGYKFYYKGEHSGKEKLVEFYRQGLSIFVINSSAGLALTADKFFVNHYFALPLANSYTFAWALAAPLFYFGNVIERAIYTIEKRNNLKTVLIKSSLVQLVLVLIYGVGVSCVVYFYPQVLPKSVSYEYMKVIVPVMIAGYGLYTICHFPLNGILLKFASNKAQEKIAFYFTIAIIVFIGIFFVLKERISEINYLTLLVIIWVYLFSLLIIKVKIMWHRV
jgi:hypothetical protein